MSWFRRSSASDTGAASTAPQNPHLQALKRQARNRLIGMAVLVLAGIALFAWVLDTEPRTSDREIVYDIPARGERLSVQIPAAAQKDATQGRASSSANTAAPASAADTPAQIRARRRAALAENEEMLDDAPLAAGSDEPAPNAAQAAAARALAAQAAAEKLAREKAQKAQQAKQEQLAQAKADKAKADKAKADEAARARALLEGKSEAKAEPQTEAKADTKSDSKASNERSVVQFGSFADPAKAAEVRRRVENLGLKTYTQEINTPRGKLIRLRAGPYNKAEDAEAAAKKIKALGLPAAILTL